MASEGPVANSTFVVTANHGYPVVPGVMSQVPVYPSNQPQIHLIPGNLPGLTQYGSQQLTRRALKEGKVLGALQILIGLIHIGFGSIFVTVLSGGYTSVSFFGGFPFWGAICFITSGSLSVSAETQPQSPCLLGGSVGMNIVSAISSVVGIALFIADIIIAVTASDYLSYPHHNHWGQSPGTANSCVLLVFCLLEFCIACTSAHFGCRVACYRNDNVSTGFTNVYVANPVVAPEPENFLPPAYPHQVLSSQ